MPTINSILGNWKYIKKSEFNPADSVVDDPANWYMLPPCELMHGDVLIKHVWPKDVVDRSKLSGGRGRSKIENLITSHSSKMNRLLGRGSRSAEHTAVICNNEAMAKVFLEAHGPGVRLEEVSVTTSHEKNHAYTVYRIKTDSQQKKAWAVLLASLGMRLTCKGSKADVAGSIYTYAEKMSTGTQGSFWKEMVESLSEERSDVQANTSYGFTTMLTMNLPGYKSIPDRIGTSNDAKMVNFILGRRGGITSRRMSHICSGLTATLLQVWMVNTNRSRVFSDPSQAHPRDLERRLLSGNVFESFERVGRWGTYEDYKPKPGYGET
jgi:hypothetical protein